MSLTFTSEIILLEDKKYTNLSKQNLHDLYTLSTVINRHYNCTSTNSYNQQLIQIIFVQVKGACPRSNYKYVTFTPVASKGDLTMVVSTTEE